jgi:hypothetical protein
MTQAFPNEGVRGAVVISGSDIAYGLGPGLGDTRIRRILLRRDLEWAQRRLGRDGLTGIGQADTIIGGSCLSSVPAASASSSAPRRRCMGQASTSRVAPISFPGNTATGSNTMAFGPPRLRGAAVLVDCQQTTFC